jgi:hypothetical protein
VVRPASDAWHVSRRSPSRPCHVLESVNWHAAQRLTIFVSDSLGHNPQAPKREDHSVAANRFDQNSLLRGSTAV